MTNNETKLNNLMMEINRKANKKLNRIIVQTAVRYGVSIREVEDKHKDHIEKTKKALIDEETKKHQAEIKAIKECIEAEAKRKSELLQKTIKVAKEQTEKKKEVLKQPSIKKPSIKKPSIKARKKNNEFGFSEEEVAFIIEECFTKQIQKGYKEVAEILGKDEKKVRKQIAHLMCELVA